MYKWSWNCYIISILSPISVTSFISRLSTDRWLSIFLETQSTYIHHLPWSVINSQNYTWYFIPDKDRFMYLYSLFFCALCFRINRTIFHVALSLCFDSKFRLKVLTQEVTRVVRPHIQSSSPWSVIQEDSCKNFKSIFAGNAFELSHTCHLSNSALVTLYFLSLYIFCYDDASRFFRRRFFCWHNRRVGFTARHKRGCARCSVGEKRKREESTGKTGEQDYREEGRGRLLFLQRTFFAPSSSSLRQQQTFIKMARTHWLFNNNTVTFSNKITNQNGCQGIGNLSGTCSWRRETM